MAYITVPNVTESQKDLGGKGTLELSSPAQDHSRVSCQAESGHLGLAPSAFEYLQGCELQPLWASTPVLHHSYGKNFEFFSK